MQKYIKTKIFPKRQTTSSFFNRNFGTQQADTNSKRRERGKQKKKTQNMRKGSKMYKTIFCKQNNKKTLFNI